MTSFLLFPSSTYLARKPWVLPYIVYIYINVYICICIWIGVWVLHTGNITASIYYRHYPTVTEWGQ